MDRIQLDLTRAVGFDHRADGLLLKDDAEALRMFREATKPEPGRNQYSSVDNINAPKIPKGTSRAYTLDRLHREAPPPRARSCARWLRAGSGRSKRSPRK